MILGLSALRLPGPASNHEQPLVPVGRSGLGGGAPGFTRSSFTLALVALFRGVVWARPVDQGPCGSGPRWHACAPLPAAGHAHGPVECSLRDCVSGHSTSSGRPVVSAGSSERPRVCSVFLLEAQHRPLFDAFRPRETDLCLPAGSGAGYVPLVAVIGAFGPVAGWTRLSGISFPARRNGLFSDRVLLVSGILLAGRLQACRLHLTGHAALGLGPGMLS